MDQESGNDFPVEEAEFISPLRAAAIEANELYIELQYAGFPDTVIAQILAHMLTDSALYSVEFGTDDDDDDYDDDEEDTLHGGDA